MLGFSKPFLKRNLRKQCLCQGLDLGVSPVHFDRILSTKIVIHESIGTIANIQANLTISFCHIDCNAQSDKQISNLNKWHECLDSKSLCICRFTGMIIKAHKKQVNYTLEERKYTFDCWAIQAGDSIANMFNVNN